MANTYNQNADIYPCDTCDLKDNCDDWEAKLCCALCYYHNEEPDCDSCDPMIR